MRITRRQDQIILALKPTEARFLDRVIHSLIQHYRLPPQELDSKTAEAWYSTRGCAKAKMSPAETKEWVHHLRQFKSARLTLLERCRQACTNQRDDAIELKLPIAEAPNLVAAFNDHRLRLAAQCELGETEMSQEVFEKLDQLTPQQHQALFEIHLLAGIIESLIKHIAPEAASWMDATDWRPEGLDEE